jgi:hypothetical protein
MWCLPAPPGKEGECQQWELRHQSRQPAAANCAPRTGCFALQQLLWKLGDGSKVPAAVAHAFCQQHVQHPQQLEREAL